MTVFLRNLQKRVIFDTAVLIRDATYLMRLLRVEKFDVSLVCTGGDLIKSLNLKYRRRNIQTDVLAFPYFEVQSQRYIMYWAFPFVNQGPHETDPIWKNTASYFIFVIFIAWPLSSDKTNYLFIWGKLYLNLQNLKPGVIPNPSGPEEYNLGDIILGMRVIEKDCQEDNRNIQEHLSVCITGSLQLEVLFTLVPIVSTLPFKALVPC